MTNLIKVGASEISGQQKQTVNARELHQFIESKRDFSNWIQQRIVKYSFIENEDFTTNLLKSSGGRPSKEYFITLDMAKELAMIENNDKGRLIRKYFIECEKKLHEKPKQQMVELLLINGGVMPERTKIKSELDKANDKVEAFKWLNEELLLREQFYRDEIKRLENEVFLIMKGELR